MQLKFKYARPSSAKPYCGTGRRPGHKPDVWRAGPDPVDHDKYYAWLKHRNQARHRGESYALTWADWQTLWPNALFLQRGRSVDDLCLMMINPQLGWCMNNVKVVSRRVQLRESAKLRKR